MSDVNTQDAEQSDAIDASGGFAAFLAGGGFGRAVPADGYAWWHVDALSDCGRFGLAITASIGSVFSPYYAAARRRGPTDPEHHCALNIALYGGVQSWAMTERGRGNIVRQPQSLRIGASFLRWDGVVLEVEIDEISTPFSKPLKGHLRVHTRSPVDHEVLLNAEGNHRWRPLQPFARVDLELSDPSLFWSGHGYFDSHYGDAPLERGFSKWHRSRNTEGHASNVVFDAQCRNGERVAFARHFGDTIHDLPLPPLRDLSPGWWGVERPTRAFIHPRLLRRLEDTPFFTRSEIASEMGHGVHESLDMDRFARRWVQVLLPLRIRRKARA